MKSLRIGVVASAGGSAFQSMYDCSRFSNRDHSYFVVTDRECGIEPFCIYNNIPCERITDDDNDSFSQRAAAYFMESQVDYILLFFSRLLTPKLFGQLPVLNIHPALLPAFKGMGAVGKARKCGVRFMGSTLHLVDENVDEGQIIAQACMPLHPSQLSASMHKFAYIQKVGLAILSMHLVESGLLGLSGDSSDFTLSDEVQVGDRLAPRISDNAYLDFLACLQNKEGVMVL